MNNDRIEELYQKCDGEFKQDNSLSQLLEQYPIDYLTVLLKKQSCDPLIRNRETPNELGYAPVYYDSECMIQLCHKSFGWIACLVQWDLFVVDLDNKSKLWTIEEIKLMILEQYPNELWYIHRTPRGYHLYLMSRPLTYCSLEAIQMRLNLQCDCAYGTNCLYRGTSLRLSRKPNDAERPSTKIEIVGQGSLDPRTEHIYQKIGHYLSLYQDLENLSDLLTVSWPLWERTIRAHDGDLGLQQIVSSTRWLMIQQESIGLVNLVDDQDTPEIKQSWMKLNQNHAFRLCRQDRIIKAFHRWRQYRNLYRILQSTRDYVIGLHTQESLYFISYADLLMVDYDCPNRLNILREYCRYHPGDLFRVTQTNHGFHAFLVSRSVYYDTQEAIDLLFRLGADPYHSLSVIHRGYSVRINYKLPEVHPYRELPSIGTGRPIPRLNQLYRKHLRLYQTQPKNWEPHMCMEIYNQMLRSKK